MDQSHRVAHSPEWFAYWHEQLNRVVRGEPAERIPLEAWDAVLAQAQEEAATARAGE